MNQLRGFFSNPKFALVIALVLATHLWPGCEAPAASLRQVAWEPSLIDQQQVGAAYAPPTPTANNGKYPAREATFNAGTDVLVDKTNEIPGADDDKPDVSNKRWHLDLAVRNSNIKLAGTKQQLDRRLDLPLQLDVFHVFERPYTPIDRKSDFQIGSWYAGVGRQENPRLLWTYYIGGGADKDLNHRRFLFQTLEVDFEYAFVYSGFMVEYYPWEVPILTPPFSWEKRLQASRPFLLAGLETGYVSAEGEGDYVVAGINAYHDEQKIRDWLFSCAVGLGWSVPVDDHWSLYLTGDYRFQFYRPEEYNGWNLTTGIRYRF